MSDPTVGDPPLSFHRHVPGGKQVLELRERLRTAKDRLGAEIESYPRPITACDAQFNRLIEDRASVDGLLARLDEAGGADANHRDRGAVAGEDPAGVPRLDNAAARGLLAPENEAEV